MICARAQDGLLQVVGLGVDEGKTERVVGLCWSLLVSELGASHEQNKFSFQPKKNPARTEEAEWAGDSIVYNPGSCGKVDDFPHLKKGDFFRLIFG